MRTIITALTLTSALVLGGVASASTGDQVPANVLEFATKAKVQISSGSFERTAPVQITAPQKQAGVSDAAYFNSGR